METILKEEEKKKPEVSSKENSSSKYTAEELETIQRMKEALPKWHGILYEGKLDTRHNIMDSRRCIVGEWHGLDK